METKEDRNPVYDRGKIIGGLAVFLCLASFPLWYTIASGKADYRAGKVLPVSENRCIETSEYMRRYHMQLLEEWRNSTVRNNNRTYKTSDNRTYDINLSNTCLGCHANKADFCDSCHSYSAVSPNCWECHIIPTPPSKQAVKDSHSVLMR